MASLSKGWMKTVGKQRDGRDQASLYAYLKFLPMNYISISIFIFMFYAFITIPIWVCLTKIYKVTIACFIPTISVGSTLTRVRFITWTTQCTCWLVVRSCDKELRLQLCVPCWWRHWWSQISCTKFLAPLPRIVRVWTTDGSSCCLD